MVATGTSPVSEKTEQSDSPSGNDTTSELRIAVAMNGGVSLAVWISGVASELLDLERCSPHYRHLSKWPKRETPVYQGILQALNQDVRLDVLAGASAGGINAALVWAALHGGSQDLHFARNVWAQTGSLAKLLQTDTDQPTSLLDGDFFREQLESTFTQLLNEGGPLQPEGSHQVRITTSLLAGADTTRRDFLGEPIRDKDHQAYFEFSFPTTADERATPQELAAAARASASFPLAFSPAMLHGKVLKRLRPPVDDDDERRIAHAVDGGALNNKPIDLLIRPILQQPAERAVRRALLYVVPDPGEPVTPEEDDDWSLAEVLMSAVVGMPRHESLRADLDAIEENNRRAQSLVDLRVSIAAGLKRQSSDADDFDTRLRELSKSFTRAYVQQRTGRSVQRTAPRIYSLIPAETQSQVPYRTLAAALEKARREHVPGRLKYDPSESEQASFVPAQVALLPNWMDTPPSKTPPSKTYWPYGHATAVRIVSGYIDLVRSCTEQELVSGAASSLKLKQCRRDLHDSLSSLMRMQDDLKLLAYEEMAAECVAEHVRQLDVWAEHFYANLFDLDAWSDGGPSEGAIKADMFEMVGSEVQKASESFTKTINDLEEVAPKGGDLSETLEALGWDPSIETPQDPNADGPEQWQRVLGRMLFLDMIHYVASDVNVPQRVDVVQVSARQPAPFTKDEVDLKMKLGGKDLFHFGAFLRESWRVGDWMWGRVDGATKIISLVLSDEMLDQLQKADRLRILLDNQALNEEKRGQVEKNLFDAEWWKRASLADKGKKCAEIRELFTEAAHGQIIEEERRSLRRSLRRDKSEGWSLSDFEQELQSSKKAASSPECYTAGLLNTEKTLAAHRHDKPLREQAVQTGKVAISLVEGETPEGAAQRFVLPAARLLRFALGLANHFGRTGTGGGRNRLWLGALVGLLGGFGVGWASAEWRQSVPGALAVLLLLSAFLVVDSRWRVLAGVFALISAAALALWNSEDCASATGCSAPQDWFAGASGATYVTVALVAAVVALCLLLAPPLWSLLKRLSPRDKG